MNETSWQLPPYQAFSTLIEPLDLPISVSELHGVMCGYLCAGAIKQGESYVRALMVNQKSDLTRELAPVLFSVYAISQQQMANFDFDFQMLLPDDGASLPERAKAFSEWCEGFTQGISVNGIGYSQLQEEDAQEALQHLAEFAQLDYHTLEITEEDERALTEVSEYARMAVLRIHTDIESAGANGDNEVSH